MGRAQEVAQRAVSRAIYDVGAANIPQPSWRKSSVTRGHCSATNVSQDNIVKTIYAFVSQK